MNEHIVWSAPPPSKVEYVVYKRRWLVLIVFVMFCASNSCLWVLYSPIFKETMIHYDASIDQVNLLSLTSSYCSIALTFPVLTFYRKHGSYTGLLIAAICNCIGAAIIFLGEIVQAGYPVVLFGQTMASSAIAFYL
eukprot:PhF_6_TR41776/c0_g1_i2/m.63389